uniref:Ras association domain family member 8a n=1 Tax=Gasterosteus aculeatus TaxID=69293 RepID=G3PCX2_GASAC
IKGLILAFWENYKTAVEFCKNIIFFLKPTLLFTGRTGRYTLVEKWRDSERHLAPHESPVASLNTWGQYAGDVQLILRRTSPSLTERSSSEEPPLREPERSANRQSLLPLAKLHHSFYRSHLSRREPGPKTLLFQGCPQRAPVYMNSWGSTTSTTPNQRATNRDSTAWARGTCRMEDLVRLVGLQRETLNVLQKKLEAYEAELQAWADGTEERVEEILRLEKHLRKTTLRWRKRSFGSTELQIELESERQLEERLHELVGRLQGCEVEIEEKLSMVQSVEAGLEEERLQRQRQETQWVSEAEARSQVLRAKTELKAQERQAVQLESSCRAVDRSLGQSTKNLQDMQHELEQLTKELRQVNLQQFIKQTGTKVTVLPAEPSEDESTHSTHVKDLVPLSGSLKRPVSSHAMSSHLRILHSPLTSGLNPEGIYV